MQPRRQLGLQVALDPLACRALFGFPVAELAGPISVPQALGRVDHDLLERVGNAETWQQRFALIGRRTAGALAESERRAQRSARRMRTDIRAAWQLLQAHRGTVGIDALAARVALSPRQLRQEFTREFGIGPKRAGKLMRFEHAMASINAAVRKGHHPQLAAIAADCGYADQAHLSREVRDFLGLSPTEWITAERRNLQAGGYSYLAE